MFGGTAVHPAIVAETRRIRAVRRIKCNGHAHIRLNGADQRSALNASCRARQTFQFELFQYIDKRMAFGYNLVKIGMKPMNQTPKRLHDGFPL